MLQHGARITRLPVMHPLTRYANGGAPDTKPFFSGDADVWEKLQWVLKAQIDPEAFEKMRGTVSFPFKPAEHQRIAVKVIDFRGNEVVRVVKLQREEMVCYG